MSCMKIISEKKKKDGQWYCLVSKTTYWLLVEEDSQHPSVVRHAHTRTHIHNKCYILLGLGANHSDLSQVRVGSGSCGKFTELRAPLSSGLDGGVKPFLIRRAWILSVHELRGKTFVFNSCLPAF